MSDEKKMLQCSSCPRKGLTEEDFKSHYRKGLMKTCLKCRKSVLRSASKTRRPPFAVIMKAIFKEYPEVLESRNPAIKFAVGKWNEN